MAVKGSLMPGDSALTATSTSWRMANSGSAEVTRRRPERGGVADRLLHAVLRRRDLGDRRAGEDVVPGPHQQPDGDAALRRPMRQALVVELLQVAVARVRHRGGVVPVVG